MKKCPYCAEEIQDEAIKCRWCGSDLSAPPPKPPGVVPRSVPQSPDASGRPSKTTTPTQALSPAQAAYQTWYRRGWVLLILLVGLAASGFGLYLWLRPGEGADTGSDKPLAAPSDGTTPHAEGVERLPRGLWVGEFHAQLLHRVDTARNEVAASTPLEGRPQDIALGQGSVWLTFSSLDKVLRIDPDTHQVLAEILLPFGDKPPWYVGDPQVEMGGRYVWVIARNRLLGIDPATIKVEVSYRIAEGILTDFSVGDGALWILLFSAEGQSHKLLRIEEATGKEVATVDVPYATSLAVGEGSVWLTGKEGDTDAVFRIDPATNIVTEGIHPQQPGTLYGVAAGDGSVWAVQEEGFLYRIDPNSGQIIASVEVGFGADDVVTSSDAVWVHACGDFDLCRIDPHTSQIVATLDIPATSELRGFAVGE